jgi:hypothetical protein
MKTRHALYCTAIVYLSALAPALAAAKHGNANPVTSTAAYSDAIGVLAADGPHASLGDQAKVMEALVGSWDVDYMDISKDGRQIHRTGQFIVSWVLDGRAIEDVWIVDPAEGRQEREVYADIRYFDAKSRSWPTVFIDPEHGSVAKFAGGATADGRLVLQSPDLGHPQNRWSFIDIQQETCVFRDEYSVDGGVSWQLQAEYRMKRRHVSTSR